MTVKVNRFSKEGAMTTEPEITINDQEPTVQVKTIRIGDYFVSDWRVFIVINQSDGATLIKEIGGNQDQPLTTIGNHTMVHPADLTSATFTKRK